MLTLLVPAVGLITILRLAAAKQLRAYVAMVAALLPVHNRTHEAMGLRRGLTAVAGAPAGLVLHAGIAVDIQL